MCKMSQKIGDLVRKFKTPRLQGSCNVITALDVMDIYDMDVLGVECEKNFVGVFTRTDFNKCVLRQNLDPRETTLYETISMNPAFVPHEFTLKDTYAAMLAARCEYMPVLKGAVLCGIVSLRDLGKDVMKSYEESLAENKMIMHYIQCGESYAMADYNDSLE